LKKNLLLPTLLEGCTFAQPEELYVKPEHKIFNEYTDMYLRRAKYSTHTKSSEITYVTCNQYNTLFQTNGGELYICGSGELGELTISKEGERKGLEDDEEADLSDVSIVLEEEKDDDKKHKDAGQLQLERGDPYLIPKFSGILHSQIHSFSYRQFNHSHKTCVHWQESYNRHYQIWRCLCLGK
jgi:hypothetical protein